MFKGDAGPGQRSPLLGQDRPAAGEYDDRRTRYLEERGIKVIRFENRRLYRDLEGVLEEIRKALNEG